MKTKETSLYTTHLSEWLKLEITSIASEDAEKLDHSYIGDGKTE